MAPALVAEGDFEEPGPLPAAHFLAPEEMEGPHWKVAALATNDGFTNSYTLTGPYGTWTARGRIQLAERIREIEALAKLEEVSKSKVFLDAVEDSVTAPIDLVRNVAERPVETVQGIPEGVGRWFRRTRFRVQEASADLQEKKAEREARQAAEEEETAEESDGERERRRSVEEKVREEASKQALRYLKISSAERRWYADLGVDPYTDNEVLRDAVEKVARVEGLTRFSMKFVPLPSLPGASSLGKTMDLVWNTHPWDLRLRNRKRLLAMGLSEETARAFEDQPALSLTQQTALVETLDRLEGVASREHLVHRALDVATRDEGRVLAAATALLLEFHREREPLAALLPGSRLPVARTAEGALVALTPTDALFWTRELAEAAEAFARLYADETAPRRLFGVTGEASPRFQEKARKLGWEVVEWWGPSRAGAEDHPYGGVD
jgi:hypothetical protein